MSDIKNMLVGVSLPFFKIMRNHESFREDMTTSEFISKIVKPDTKERKCAYFELFAGKKDEKGRLYVAPATAFVSHAWKYKFMQCFDVLEHHDDPDAYFSLDLFTNNQHDTQNVDHNEWVTTFQQSIASIGMVLVVMSPWNDPVPLTRVS